MRPRIFSDKDWQSGFGRQHFQLSFRSSRTLLCNTDTSTTKAVRPGFASFFYENVVILYILLLVVFDLRAVILQAVSPRVFGTRYQDGIQVRS